MLKREPKDSEIIFKEIKAREINAKSHQITRKIVDDLITKFFWIVWTNTRKRNALLYWQRLIDSSYDIENIETCKSVKKTIEDILKNRWTWVELFLWYLIEKQNHWKVKVLISPFEMDNFHATDIIISTWKLNIATDITFERNWKLERFNEHCNAMKNISYIPEYLKNGNRENFLKTRINSTNYSQQFIPDARMLIKIGWKSKIKKNGNEQFFLDTYNSFIKDNRENIEESLLNKYWKEKIELEEISYSLIEIINLISQERQKWNNLIWRKIEWKKGIFIINKNNNLEEKNSYLIEYKSNRTNDFLFTIHLYIPERTCYK